MKVFHYKDKIDSLPPEAEQILPPVHIRIKPTNICNHNCRYCAYRADNLQLGKDMNVRDSVPPDKMSEIIDDIIEMGVNAVTFSGGGEPFCYPHLSDIAKKLSQSPVKFAALTNGALLKGEVAEVFAHHATWLRISIDGWDGPSYAEYRGVSDNEFDKVIDNMRNFKKHGGPCYTGASVIVDRTNAGHVYDLIAILSDTGINSVKVSPCIVSNSGKENNEHHEPIFGIVKEQVARARDKFETGDFEIFDSYHEQLESFAKDYTWCPYLQILPIIGADQNVYSCQDKAYNIEQGLIGSIKNTTFKDFWFSDKNKFFSINPSLNCNHHCVADAKNRLLFDYLDADKDHLGFV
jgi:MoaA/NifB/PqqE/SkfB family radical SAM enzyme